MSKFKVGDKISFVRGGWGVSDGDIEKLKGRVFEIIDYLPDGYFGEEGYLVNPSLMKSFDYVPGEYGYIGAESFELVEEQASEERGMSVNKPDWKDAPSWATVLLKHVTNPSLYAFAEKYHEGERFTRSDYNFEVVYDVLLPIHWDVVETRQEESQTSNQKPSFVSFFTNVIVAKNKDVSDIGELLYDENSTKISLEDEGGGAFLIVEQDYNGAIQQIRLDTDEVDAVFSAIKQLVKQLEGK